MPLAANENPPELFTSASSERIEDIGGPLCVIFTRSRQEKAVARVLHSAGIPYFLPYLARRDASRNRVLSPLFTGILFAAAAHPSEDANPALSPEIQELASTRKGACSLTCKQLENVLYFREYPNCPLLDGEAFISELRGTFRILRPSNQKQLRKELAFLAGEPSSRRTARAETEMPRVGSRVRIIAGPMLDTEGKVATVDPQRSTGKVRIFIDSVFLGQVLSIEVLASDIETLS